MTSSDLEFTPRKIRARTRGLLLAVAVLSLWYALLVFLPMVVSPRSEVRDPAPHGGAAWLWLGGIWTASLVAAVVLFFHLPATRLGSATGVLSYVAAGFVLAGAVSIRLGPDLTGPLFMLVLLGLTWVPLLLHTRYERHVRTAITAQPSADEGRFE